MNDDSTGADVISFPFQGLVTIIINHFYSRVNVIGILRVPRRTSTTTLQNVIMIRQWNFFPYNTLLAVVVESEVQE
ncbi:hypothetical protein V1478_017646 [Vespula squamosa]|uniref:Uncharacterized protein n=1 Tax=Vespula squamosa TaxID=30214 RepID=A0ABD1ZWF5_VESSQ